MVESDLQENCLVTARERELPPLFGTADNNTGTLYTAKQVHCIQQHRYTVHSNTGTLYTATQVHCTQQHRYTVYSNTGTLYTATQAHCTQHR